MNAKAPVGGITSSVNGQFYEGGQFTPDHGKFCGKGKYRVTQAEFDEVAVLAEQCGKTLIYREKYSEFALLSLGGNVWMRSKRLGALVSVVKPKPEKSVQVNPF